MYIKETYIFDIFWPDSQLSTLFQQQNATFKTFPSTVLDNLHLVYKRPTCRLYQSKVSVFKMAGTAPETK